MHASAPLWRSIPFPDHQFPVQLIVKSTIVVQLSFALVKLPLICLHSIVTLKIESAVSGCTCRSSVMMGRTSIVTSWGQSVLHCLTEQKRHLKSWVAVEVETNKKLMWYSSADKGNSSSQAVLFRAFYYFM
jgi:hypothetical protein